jgi:AAA+ superfamily predicted ATPase
MDELFERRIEFPDVDAQQRLAALVGRDGYKDRLSKILGTMVNPGSLEQWAKEHHPDAGQLTATVRRRSPLVILAGDVGSGKTELGECIGDEVARKEGVDITLLPLSLSARGQGRVGEMTQLLSSAFSKTFEEASKLKSSGKRSRGAVILLVDEADALAQSRETAQMHHEDRAGVNAFIRGVDRLANGNVPAAVIMCTNRLAALDPAVRRRAADILQFGRPDVEERRQVLLRAFAGIPFHDDEIDALVTATGPRSTTAYGFTFSDLTQRLLPAIVLDAYPTRPLTGARAMEIANSIVPTPPFNEG